MTAGGRDLAAVALVLVSHSGGLAEGAAELAGQMAPGVLIVPAGGLEGGLLGTDYGRIEQAVARAAGEGRSVVVLTDLGSAVLTTEAVLEMADPDVAERVVLADAPFVEGAVAAAVTAHGGASLAEVQASAEHAGSLFGSRAPQEAGEASDEGAADGVVRATRTLLNPLGLHARPAAVVARMLAAFDAQVAVNGVNAASVLELMKLGATQGAELRIEASGAQASAAVDALTAAIDSGFGEI
ncbi:PTS-dependent dihydroxyacetone kinase phosphotransferase subunit DhaM [Cellulomonas sp. DKR-3]|uniref:Phosphocarrier protein HPr n=1 Tax=Cellulomonas fulva TaxID=2835530 RepID=A0ABS5U2R7_9CELL|nr:dihydroxyacetone kinase phosphoryl donor subunit DhaM [Cellulomonas fulva]MBT0995699.1 PTS-dependent dihydroxyacetone kinase phosphotransferase subunit DhaM [Cellulomonas fulva]